MTPRFLSLTPLTPLALCVLLTGCPDKGAGGGGTAPLGSGVPMTGRIKKPVGTSPTAPPPAPVEAGPFSKDALVELYRADQLGSDAERRAVQKKHGLVDDAGKEVPERVTAYCDALKKFAESRVDEWSALADEIEAARVTSSTSPNVQGK